LRSEQTLVMEQIQWSNCIEKYHVRFVDQIVQFQAKKQPDPILLYGFLSGESRYEDAEVIFYWQLWPEWTLVMEQIQ
jgi:hypothetical protein